MKRLALLLLLLAPAAHAAPTGGAIVAGYGNEYVTRFALVVHGTEPVFVNADPVKLHDVTSLDVDAAGRPLFSTRVIGFGQSQPVAGVSSLEPGMWSFVCSVHPNMFGTLVVV